MTGKIQKNMRNKYATIHITSRCNINCRHCFESIGRGECLQNLPDAKQEDVISWIKKIAMEKSIRSVSFVGGEPFLCLDELTEYIKYAKEAGMLTKVVTNGYWATSIQYVDEMLNKMQGLDTIIVSSDKYHLEFVDKEIVDNLVNGCIKNNRTVVIHVTAANMEEGEEIKRLYANSYSNQITISVSPIFVFEETPQDIKVDTFNYMEQPQLLKKHCQLGCPMIKTNGEMYTCFGSQVTQETNEDFFYLGNLTNNTYEDMLNRRGEPLLHKFMESYGPVGLAKMINNSPLKDAFSKMEFTQDCHMCTWALTNMDFYNYIVNLLEKKQVKNSNRAAT